MSRDNNRNIRDIRYRKEIVTQLGVRMIILIMASRVLRAIPEKEEVRSETEEEDEEREAKQDQKTMK